MILKKVWVVTYLENEGEEPIVTVFDNEEAATKFFKHIRYKHLLSKHVTYIDHAPVYHDFSIIGEEE